MQDDVEQSATESNEEIKPLLTDEPNQRNEQIQALQEDLAKEQDARKEERFVWLLISIILLNITFFTSMQSLLGPLVIGAFELVLLVIIAQRMGKEEIVQLIDRLVGSVVKAASKSE